MAAMTGRFVDWSAYREHAIEAEWSNCIADGRDAEEEDAMGVTKVTEATVLMAMARLSVKRGTDDDGSPMPEKRWFIAREVADFMCVDVNAVRNILVISKAVSSRVREIGGTTGGRRPLEYRMHQSAEAYLAEQEKATTLHEQSKTPATPEAVFPKWAPTDKAAKRDGKPTKPKARVLVHSSRHALAGDDERPYLGNVITVLRTVVDREENLTLTVKVRARVESIEIVTIGTPGEAK